VGVGGRGDVWVWWRGLAAGAASAQLPAASCRLQRCRGQGIWGFRRAGATSCATEAAVQGSGGLLQARAPKIPTRAPGIWPGQARARLLRRRLLRRRLLRPGWCARVPVALREAFCERLGRAQRRAQARGRADGQPVRQPVDGALCAAARAHTASGSHQCVGCLGGERGYRPQPHIADAVTPVRAAAGAPARQARLRAPIRQCVRIVAHTSC
jgi:hypothetical protein